MKSRLARFAGINFPSMVPWLNFGESNTKLSNWLKTPADIRKLGGAIFGDRRFGRVFIYHYGAESCYGGRGFRGWLRV